MIDLIMQLKVIAQRANKSDAAVIEKAVNRIRELEDKLSDYEEDITDWQNSVVLQMNGRKNNL